MTVKGGGGMDVPRRTPYSIQLNPLYAVGSHR